MRLSRFYLSIILICLAVTVAACVFAVTLHGRIRSVRQEAVSASARLTEANQQQTALQSQYNALKSKYKALQSHVSVSGEGKQ